jgi:ABC-type methionine transport system ATPase subunit
MGINVGQGPREARGLKLLKQFGVFEQAKKLPTELSGGQQQRVAICRSVMNDPDILLADEPVGNLDSKSSEEVMKLLRELNDRDKTTVILVSHDPSHLHHAHRVFFMRDGQIIRVQTNTEAERKESPVMAVAKTQIHPALEQWAKTIAPDAIKDADGAMSFLSAQEIVAEVLTGMTAKDVARLDMLAQEIVEGRHGA